MCSTYRHLHSSAVSHKNYTSRMHTARKLTVCEGGGVNPRQTPPLCEQTDSCENMTFQQLLLRAVTRMHSSRMLTAHSSGRLWLGGGVHPVTQPHPHHPLLLHTPIEWLTDKCKNMTFPKLRFRTVIKLMSTFILHKNAWWNKSPKMC